MSSFINEIIKNANSQIKYNNTVTTGEITADNGDGTYKVKIDNASSAIPYVENLAYDAVFSVGEIVTIGFENGCKESPKIMGHSKKIAQNPVQVEVDYSGGCSGIQTVETTLYCTSASGSIYAADNASDYTKCHNSVDGSDLHDIGKYTDSIYIDQTWQVLATTYGIERGFLFFDTSAIPTGAVITSAILKLYCISKTTTTDFNVVIQNGQPNYPHNPLIDGDYDYSKYSNNGGQKTASAFTLNAYNNITLNSNGIAWINKGGITKFCLRCSQDIAGVAPTDVTSNIGIIASEVYSGKTDYAKLTITYTI